MGGESSKITAPEANHEETAFKEKLMRMNRRPNVLVVGLPGAGKSSLITSFQSCLTHSHYEEVGAAGQFSAGSFTYQLRQYNVFEHDAADLPTEIRRNFPIFYDMPGLNNSDDSNTRALLKAVVDGRMVIDEQLLVDACHHKNISELFGPPDDALKIDRIIFVHSCTEDVPTNLADAVRTVSNECGLTVFGVLSKIDKTKKIQKKEVDMAIGTTGTMRSCELELYHSGMAVNGKIPDKDETNYYLYLLLRGIINPHYRFLSTDQTTP